ncbi:MAG: 23S rRNA (uracil(1939)-C(5))-methyltransferase RlmD [Clostridiales bacterium]|jgi:23S rRNA (uracil1939-C5)-methyltransferase|nr:23S rRNA (uracil(1939)-C(5))-methyltransferase RlmD [Clostridiales bacterium]
MRINDIIEIDIIGIGCNAEGVARHCGTVVFAPFCDLGERVRARVSYAGKSYAFAEVEEVIVRSPFRVKPPCIHFGRCGGCDCQHIAYERQAEHKERIVKETLSKLIDISGIKFFGIQCGENKFFYRNKLQMPVAAGNLTRGADGKTGKNGKYSPGNGLDKEFGNEKRLTELYEGDSVKGKDFSGNRLRDEKRLTELYKGDSGKKLKNERPLIGFFEKDSHRVVDIKKCLLHGDFADKTIAAVREYAEKFGVSAYDERTGKGVLRHVAARKIGEHTAVLIVVNADGLPAHKELAAILSRVFSDFSLHISVNKKNTNVVLGDNVKTLYGKPAAEYNAFGIKAEISPLSFMQVNDEVRDMIYRRVLDLIGENGPDTVCREGADSGVKNRRGTVIDAYSGGGLLTAMLARNAKKAYGIEIVGDAVRDANALFERNGIRNAENIEGDAAEVLPRLIERIKKEDGNGDGVTVVLDPPRKGCARAVVDALNTSEPEKIIYISCNPATLARDLSLLKEKYDIISVYPYDMFPNTKHIECVASLSRKGK